MSASLRLPVSTPCNSGGIVSSRMELMPVAHIGVMRGMLPNELRYPLYRSFCDQKGSCWAPVDAGIIPLVLAYSFWPPSLERNVIHLTAASTTLCFCALT